MSDLSISSMESKLGTYVQVKVMSATSWSKELNRGSTYMNVGALGSWAIGATSPVPAGNISAATLINRIRNYANAACRWRYAVTGLRKSNDGSWSVISQAYGFAAVTDAYRFSSTALLNHISARAPVYGITPGGDVSSANMDNFLTEIYNVWRDQVSSAGLLDLRACHDSCHDRCHSNRTRR